MNPQPPGRRPRPASLSASATTASLAEEVVASIEADAAPDPEAVREMEHALLAFSWRTDEEREAAAALLVRIQAARQRQAVVTTAPPEGGPR